MPAEAYRTREARHRRSYPLIVPSFVAVVHGLCVVF